MIFLLFQVASSAAVVPSDSGLEYTLPDNKHHYTLPDSRIHYTLPDSLLHWTLPKED